MKKSSRLNTSERAVLIIASSGEAFSIMTMLRNLKKVYSDISYSNVSRAIKNLANLKYFDIKLDDPYFSNSPSYTLNSLGHNFWKEHQIQEEKLYNLINTTTPALRLSGGGWGSKQLSYSYVDRSR